MEVQKVNTNNRPAKIISNSIAAGIAAAGCTYFASPASDKHAAKAFVLGKDSFVKSFVKHAERTQEKSASAMAEVFAKDAFPNAKERGKQFVSEIAKNSGAVVVAIIAGSVIADLLLKDSPKEK